MKRAMLVGAVVVAVILGASPAGGVGPPGRSGRLTGEQEARLGRVYASLDRAAYAGEMGRALRLAQEVESLRRGWQGAGHWQAVDARFQVEYRARLAKLSGGAQKEAGVARWHHAICMNLQARGQFAAAEVAGREALAIRRKALGEGHPDTALSYNTVAYCLQAQGKAAQALPLYERALAICRKALGEGHPDTALSYNNVASCLHAQGKAAEALPLHEKALAIHKKALGEAHPHTAHSYNNVAGCLYAQGKAAQALPLLEKGLAIRRKALGDDHFETAQSYNNVAYCLQAQGKAAQALPLYERALAIHKKALGEDHPSTALSYSNVAGCLQEQGMAALALPLHEKALAIRRKALGEEHPDTAASYNNVASCLHAQGMTALALPLLQKALAIHKKALGEGHPSTALSYSNVAYCLQAQGKAAQALPLHERALAIHKKALGEGHPSTAISYSNVASCLQAQGKVAEALPLFEKTLAIHKKALGEAHPYTGQSYNNVAGCLHNQGQAAQALPLFEKALAIRRKALGDDHFETAHSYHNLAGCLHTQGQHKEAIAQWQRALLGFDFARLARADTGFDRARFGADRLTPRQGLALAHARLKEAGKAWQYVEADLARNLLDDQAGSAPEEVAAAEQLRKLDGRLTPLFGLAQLTEDQKALRDELERQRRDLLQRLAKAAAGRSEALVWPLGRVQEQLPADGAVVLWVGAQGENWGCVVRKHGAPRWQPLTGTGAKGAWTADDYGQPWRLYAALADAGSSAARRRELTEAVRKRWFAPLERHLGAEGKRPAVRRLFVAPSPYMAGLPVEVLAPGYTVSYTPSATVLAQALKGHRALKAAPALALGDPAFQAPALAAAPKHGILVSGVQAGGLAEKAGLRAGDVLVRYDGAKLEGVSDLVAALKKNREGKTVLWREGQEVTVAPPLPLDFGIDRRPVPEAVRAFREANAPVVRGEAFAALPGTRAEVRALRRLLGPGCVTLLGSEASERSLGALRPRLHAYRVLHLATHGEVNLAFPERSRLILARDRLPSVSENAERVAKGLRPHAGELTVETILQDWRLDADLVVLSACQTGLGAASTGEGLLGFPYALMRVGARSVVLSRWKVSDEATALLMVRFYENLLGKTKGQKGPMGRAEALAEAKRWLSELPKGEAEGLVKHLKAGTMRGTVGDALPPAKGKAPALPGGERPFAHPYYWAAFTLVGDPD